MLQKFLGSLGIGNELDCFQSPTARAFQNVKIIGSEQQDSPIYSPWIQRDAGGQSGCTEFSGRIWRLRRTFDSGSRSARDRLATGDSAKSSPRPNLTLSALSLMNEMSK